MEEEEEWERVTIEQTLTQHLLPCWQRSTHKPHSNPVKLCYHDPHFVEDTKAQKG